MSSFVGSNGDINYISNIVASGQVLLFSPREAVAAQELYKIELGSKAFKPFGLPVSLGFIADISLALG